MKCIKIVGVTKHGKARINQHGSEWIVLDERKDELVLKSKEPTFAGRQHDIRRIQKSNDPDFEILSRLE